MFVDLVDALRCPNAHRESWLVASAELIEGRDIVSGVLGCPVCLEQFAITEGIADFRRSAGARPVAAPRVTDVEQATRLAAFLNLVDPSGYAVLCGEWSIHAPALRALIATHLLLVNAPSGVTVGQGTSGIAVDGALPLAAGSARGVALDPLATPEFITSCVRALAERGRLIGPASIAVPAGVSELARDASLWVGVRDADPGRIVTIAKPRRNSGGTAGSR